jgi:hypothetical protein
VRLLTLFAVIFVCVAVPSAVGADDGLSPAPCGSADVNTLEAVGCLTGEPVPSLDPSAGAQTPASVAAASPAASDPAQLPAYCRLAGEAVFYTATDWLRLGQHLAADESPCVNYYVSIPPLAADKTRLRCGQDDLIRALGPRFHAVAEFNFAGWNNWVNANGKTWFEAGAEFRNRMAACGYDIASGDTWSLNEIHSGVRRNSENARANLRDLLRGLYQGDGSVPASRGIVFVIGVGQNTVNFSEYKPQLEGWLRDGPFWADLDSYVRIFAQEAYPDARFWGVADASREQRTLLLSDFLEHPLLLAENGPPSTETARDFLENAYVPLGGAAWRWAGGFGYTAISDDQMKRLIAEQTYAVRHFAGTRPHAAPGPRFAMAWAPNNTCTDPDNPGGTVPCMDPTLFAQETAAILDRLADSLHEAYEQGGGTPEGACGPPGDRTWCSADVPGATFNDRWLTFATWN